MINLFQTLRGLQMNAFRETRNHELCAYFCALCSGDWGFGRHTSY